MFISTKPFGFAQDRLRERRALANSQLIVDSSFWYTAQTWAPTLGITERMHFHFVVLYDMRNKYALAFIPWQINELIILLYRDPFVFPAVSFLPLIQWAAYTAPVLIQDMPLNPTRINAATGIIWAHDSGQHGRYTDWGGPVTRWILGYGLLYEVRGFWWGFGHA